MPKELSAFSGDNTQDLDLDSAIQARGFWSILKDSALLYKENFIPFTRPLILPIVLKILGSVLAVLLPLFVIENAMEWLLTLRIPVRFLTGFLLCLPGIFLLCRGFWLYMVYISSFNINIVEQVNNKTADFQKAYYQTPAKEYSQMLLLLVAIWLPAFAAYLIGLIGSAIFASNPLIAIGFPLLCLLGSLLLLLAGIVAAVYFSMAFQVFSLEPEYQNSGVSVLNRSFQLVKNNFWRTFALLLILSIFTGMIAPFFVTLFLDILQLSHLFMAPAMYFVHIMLDSIPKDITSQLESFGINIYDEAPSLALDVIHIFSNTATTLFLLPLGSFVHCLLYLDIRASKSNSDENSSN